MGRKPPRASVRPLTMPLEEAMRTQRAIRRFTRDPVSDELLLHLIELATKAPAGGGRQYAEFIIVRDRAVKAELARLNRLAWSTYGTIWRWFARDDEKTLREMKAVDYLVDHYEDVPAVVVACVRWNTYGPIVSGVRLPFPPFLASVYYGSIFPAVQNFLLAARAAGLGAALTVMPLWSTLLARRVLGMPIWSSPVAAIPVGWPMGRYGPTTRPPVSAYVHYDAYGQRQPPAGGGRRRGATPARPSSRRT